MKNCVRVLLLAASFCPSHSAFAQPTSPPVYSRVLNDAVTGGNDFISGGFRFYTINPGADQYQIDLYERPTSGGYQFFLTSYAAEEYHAYIDITTGRFGYDNQFVYAAIELAGLDIRTKDGVNNPAGLRARYGVRFGPDPDGRFSTLLRVAQPETAGLPNNVYTSIRAEGYRDTDGDVGGRAGPLHGGAGPSGINVTKTDNILEEQGLNGYDQQFITSDGLLESSGQPVMWQRISPTNPNVVEIAFDYVAAGLTRADLDALRYLHFEAVEGGPSDPSGGLWNDQFTGIEAGSPNPGIGTDNEFGTQGLGSINLVDTVRLLPNPTCPADFNRDGFVNPDDLSDYIACYFAQPPCAAGDLNADTIINPDDLSDFIAAYFTPCV